MVNFVDFIMLVFNCIYKIGQYLYNFLTIPLNQQLKSLTIVEKLEEIPLIGNMFSWINDNIFGFLDFAILSEEGILIFVSVGLLFLILKHVIGF